MNRFRIHALLFSFTAMEYTVNRLNELVNPDLQVLIFSLFLLGLFMTAFFVTASKRRGRRAVLRPIPEGADTPDIETLDLEYETVTDWISLRHAGTLSASGRNGSAQLPADHTPQEIRALMREIGLEIAVQDIQLKPEPHVRLEIRVNNHGYFELGKRKGPSPFEYTLPRVTHSRVTLSVWQPFINFNKEQVYSQVRFGRLEDAANWRLVFEIQHITDQFTHIDYEIFWEQVSQDRPATVVLGSDTRPDRQPGPSIFFRNT